jgi:serine protease Do
MRILAVLISLIISSNVSANSYQSEGFADIVEPLMPAVVNINTVKYVKKKQNIRRFRNDHSGDADPFDELFERFGFPFFMDEMPTNPKATSLGSGFLISSDGEIVTNHHVIADADEIMVKLNDNKEYPAKLIGSDQKTDIALLKIDTKIALPFVKFGDSAKARVGDNIIAIGNPFGLGGTVTAGIISSKSRDIDIINGGLIDDYIQTDAAINGGNSGGPMFNMRGEVIGVNTAILTPSGTNIGIGFAIPSNSVQDIVKKLKTSGKIERGRLGIRIQELTPEMADGLGIKQEEGAILAGVEAGSAGEKAGLKAGDIIIEFNGMVVKSVRKLQIMVADTPINKEVEIKLIRNGKEKIVKAKIEESKDSKLASSDSKSSSGIDTKGITLNGVKFADLNSDIVQSLGLEEGQTGVVVVLNKSEDSWRSLAKGDIIVGVNQTEINNTSDLKKEYENSKKLEKKNIVFLVNRGSMTIFLTVPLK